MALAPMLELEGDFCTRCGCPMEAVEEQLQMRALLPTAGVVMDG